MVMCGLASEISDSTHKRSPWKLQAVFPVGSLSYSRHSTFSPSFQEMAELLVSNDSRKLHD